MNLYFILVNIINARFIKFKIRFGSPKISSIDKIPVETKTLKRFGSTCFNFKSYPARSLIMHCSVIGSGGAVRAMNQQSN